METAMPSNKTDDNLTAEERAQLEGSEKVRHWVKELDEALKREKDFREEGVKLLKLYECDEDRKNQFNILYSNTATMAPALYNNTPTPVVKRRFKDDDPLAKESCRVGKRLIEFFLDPGGGTYTTFDDAVRSRVNEALVPGRGVLRIDYDSELEEIPATEEGQEPTSRVKYESVCVKEVPWNRFLHGYGKRWEDLPWIAFEHFMNREELIENFGDDLGNAVEFDACSGGEDSDDKDSVRDERTPDLAHIFEIWDKKSKNVIFISKCYSDKPLKEAPDSYGLLGFFPCPKPLGFVERLSRYGQVPLYQVYKAQAEELNELTVRIQRLIAQMRVRGGYDSSVKDIENILKGEDGDLSPIDGVANLQQGNGGGGVLDKAIWLVPIEKYIPVLQQLYAQRAQVKQVIYEITGISDIMRGSSAASETATAQNIKDQWGTLRIKAPQKEAARFVRDALRIALEIAVTKFSQETIRKMTGMQYPTAQEKQQAQMAAQELQAQMQAQMMQAQQAQIPGQPPAPPPQQPQLPPEFQKALASPSWEDLLGLLKDDQLRSYRIDVETNSTVDAEATEEKSNISEFLNALGQFFNSVGPLVMNGTLPFEVAKSVMLYVARRYRVGEDLEDELQKMQQPQPPQQEGEGKEAPGGDPQALAMADKAKAQSSIQAETAKQQTLQMDLEFQKAEHAFRMEELAMKRQVLLAQHQKSIADTMRPPAPAPRKQ